MDLTRPLHFAFTYDEEVGCYGARHLVTALAARELRPAMAAIEGHKGCCEYTARFEGLAGHGSDPDAGVNAVVEYAARLLELREPCARPPSPTARFSRPGPRSSSAA